MKTMKTIYETILVGIVCIGLLILGADHEDGLTKEVLLIKGIALVLMLIAGYGLYHNYKEERQEEDNELL